MINNYPVIYRTILTHIYFNLHFFYNTYKQFTKTHHNSIILKKKKKSYLLPSKYKIESAHLSDSRRRDADRIYRVETTPAINLNPSIPYRPPYFSLRSRPTVSVLPPSVILRREGRRGEEGGEEEVAGRFQEEKSQYGHWSIRFPPTLLRPVKYVTGSGGSGDIEDTQGRREGGKGERGGGLGPDTEGAC